LRIVADLMMLLSDRFWPRLENPVIEILVHLVVTILSILSIALIEVLLHAIGLDGKLIPGTSLSLSSWMFWLEIVAASAIIIVGIFKATVALVRS
jgi:hypothetical protein